MPESNIVLYITAEVAVLLLLLCAFLLIHVGKLKKLIKKLEEKIVSLRKSIGVARNETKSALKKLAEREAVKPRAFIDYLDEELESTKTHHQSLNPDRDIVLDIAPDSPIERQASSLRHAFLIAEKEARYAGGEDASSWDVLQAKFQQIIQFYASTQPPAAASEPEDEPVDIVDDEDSQSEEIENYKKRIENLERFKKLFFEMEGKWESAKQQADEYYQQLLAMGKELGAGEDFDDLMNRYAHSFDEVGGLIIEGSAEKASSGRGLTEGEIDQRERPSVGKTVIANQEEMQRLRNMAVDQHKVITGLKKKLYEAESVEQKQEVIEQLTVQLEQQERFLKEAETCTQLIEDELSRAIRENEELHNKLKQLHAQPESDADSTEEKEHLESVVSELTNESKEMLSTIAALEEENQSLKEMLESGAGDSGAAASDENTEKLKSKLAEMQQELLNLQTQHIELEERYLELKMR